MTTWAKSTFHPGLNWRFGAVVDVLYRWQSRYAERRQLRQLSDHMLKDIGLSRADVEREASKPVWRL